MDSVSQNANATQEGTNDDTITDVGEESTIAKLADTEDDCSVRESGDYSETDDELPFKPYDINNDGRVVKTASRCSRGSWRRPEVGWDVLITIHRFGELADPKTVEDSDNVSADSDSSTRYKRRVEPADLQIELKLGGYEGEGFPQGAIRDADSAGVDLHYFLHYGIATMGMNERATFIVTTDKAKTDKSGGDGDDANRQPRRLEYDVSLDEWTEEEDLSEEQDGSLVKRVLRDGDGTTQPVEVAVVTVRCRITRSRVPSDDDSQSEDDETVVFDNLQSQDDVTGDGDSSSEDLKGPLSFTVDDCPFGQGVTEIVKSMTMGEQCEAWLDPQHGPVVEAEDGKFCHYLLLDLLEVEDLPHFFEAVEVRLKMATRFKLEGNEQFGKGDYVRALRRYDKAIRYADGVPPMDASDDASEDERGSDTGSEKNENFDEKAPVDDDGDAASSVQTDQAFVDLRVAILCNQAACHLKLEDGWSALELAERASELKALGDSAAGIKAAYRRACALEAVADWSRARRGFECVLEVDPKNVSCAQGLARLAQSERAYEATLRSVFGGCLVNEKLKGFASDGRELQGAARSEALMKAYERGDFEGAPLARNGARSDGGEVVSDSESESQSESESESDSDGGAEGETDSGDEREEGTCSSDDDDDDDDDDVTSEDEEPDSRGKPTAVMLEEEKSEALPPKTPATDSIVEPELVAVPTSVPVSPTHAASERDTSLTTTPCPVATATTATTTASIRAVVAHPTPTVTEAGMTAPASEPAGGGQESGRTIPLPEIAKGSVAIETPSIMPSLCLDGLLKGQGGRLDGAVMPPAPPPLHDAAGGTEETPLKERVADDAVGQEESETGVVGACS